MAARHVRTALSSPEGWSCIGEMNTEARTQQLIRSQF